MSRALGSSFLLLPWPLELLSSRASGLFCDVIAVSFFFSSESLSVDGPSNNFFQDLMRDFAKDVTSSSVLCLRIAFTDIPILVDCNNSSVMGIFLSSFSKSNAPAAFFFCTILSIFLAIRTTSSSMAPADLPRASRAGREVRAHTPASDQELQPLQALLPRGSGRRWLRLFCPPAPPALLTL